MAIFNSFLYVCQRVPHSEASDISSPLIRRAWPDRWGRGDHRRGRRHCHLMAPWKSTIFCISFIVSYKWQCSIATLNYRRIIIYIYMYVCYYVIGRMICCHCRSQGLQDSTKISVPTFEGPWRLDGVLRVISFLALCLLFCLGVGLCWGRVPKIEGLFDGWLQDDSSLTPLNMALHMPPLIAGNIQKTWRKWWETMIYHPQTGGIVPYVSHFQTKPVPIPAYSTWILL